jgi:hypothetical protein
LLRFSCSNWSENTTTNNTDSDAKAKQSINGPHQTKQNGCHLPPAITLGDENQSKDGGEARGNGTATNSSKRTSLLADEDDLIPLIDVQSSTEDIPELVNITAKRQNSTSQRQVRF